MLPRGEKQPTQCRCSPRSQARTCRPVERESTAQSTPLEPVIALEDFDRIITAGKVVPSLIFQSLDPFAFLKHFER